MRKRWQVVATVPVPSVGGKVEGVMARTWTLRGADTQLRWWRDFNDRHGLSQTGITFEVRRT